MAAKDRYGNNLRRGARVVAADGSKKEGEITATNTDRRSEVLVQWDNEDEETRYKASGLILKDRSMR
jgi:hypothetical protein